MTFSKIIFGLLFSGIILLSGCLSRDNADAASPKFNRLFCWNFTNDERDAVKFAEAGVTDILVTNQKQYDLAVKNGMTPYWKCFTPVGPYQQVMTPEETKHYDYINGKDIGGKMPYKERIKTIHDRRREVQHRYGGESVMAVDVLCSKISCFISDEELELSRKLLDQMIVDAPDGVAGMFLDYFGYMNNRGCYCEKCLVKYRKYLEDKKLRDTPENRTSFYLEKLVNYYNKVIDYIKSKHPDYKIVLHVYPDFREEHLYGNRINADYCGQTVSWYFKFDESKIRKYTKYVLNHAKDYYPRSEGIPFIGLSANKNNSLGSKTPEEVEHDLLAILSAGGRTLMVCDSRNIIKPGYIEVFKKYCGRK